jgi:hypothetical protein
LYYHDTLLLRKNYLGNPDKVTEDDSLVEKEEDDVDIDDEFEDIEEETFGENNDSPNGTGV